MRFRTAWARTRALVNRIEQLEQRTVFASGQLDPTFGANGSVLTEFDPTAAYSDGAQSTVIDSANRILAAGEGGMARFLPDGSIDSSFGPDGRVATPFYTRAMALQSDGKIVIVGGTQEFNSTDFMVARYLPDGQLDPTFDSDGIAQVDVGGNTDWATTVLIEPNGRIVVAGGAGQGMAVARLLPTGQLDTSFSTDGWLAYQVNHSDTAYGLARQTNGRILVVGTSLVTQTYPQTNFDMFVMRLSTNGNIDTTFGSRGMSYANFTLGRYSSDQGRGIAVQPDGKIVISGSAYGGFREYTGVARFLSDGTLDPTFGVDGRTTVEVSQDIAASNILPLADGSLLVSNYRGVLAFNSSGVLEPTFNGNGVVIANGSVNAMARQSDGAIVLAGYFYNGFAVKRLLASGSPDNSFSSDSIAVAPMGPSLDTATRSALQTDGKIIVVGGGQLGFQVARYQSDGQLDPSFSSDGLLVHNFGDQYINSLATAVAVQNDGRIVVAGWLREYNNPTTDARIAVMRLNVDGTLDSSFSNDGIVLTGLTGYAEAHAILIQPNGRILVAGAWNDVATLLRFNSDGSYDSQFSQDGVVSMASPSTIIHSLALQPDGRILAAGYQRPSSLITTSYGSVLMVARFNANGSLDATFGIKGKMLDPGSRQRTADDIVLLPNGQFVVTGDTSIYRQGIESTQMAVSRYNPDGSIDGVFGTRLIEQYEAFGYNDFESSNVISWSSAIERQPDGKLVVAGYSNQRAIVARLNEDGSLDSSFGGDGLVDSLVTGLTLRATDVLIQPDGKLVVSGYTRGVSLRSIDHDFYVMRLSNQTLPAYSSSVRINTQGNLEILDAWGRDDRLLFQRTTDAIVVTDTTADARSFFQVINVPEVTGSGSRQITIPLSLIQATGKPLVVNSMDGDDYLTFDPTFEAPTTGFVFKAGNGSDRMLIPNSPVPVTWALATVHSGSARPQGKVPISFNGIEGLVGGTQNDSFRLVHQGSPQILRVDGGGGSDSIELRADANMSFSYQPIRDWGQRLNVDGVAGMQTTTLRGIESARLIGGASNNTIDAREFWGTATLYGAAGDDVLVGAREASSLFGDDGNDQLYVLQANNNVLRGGRGDDLLSGAYFNDTLYGEDGQDVLVGGYQTDKLYGGNGDDLLIGGNSWALNVTTPANVRDAVLDTWRSTDTYLQKIQKLSVDGVGADNSIKLRIGEAVYDDFNVDTFLVTRVPIGFLSMRRLRLV